MKKVFCFGNEFVKEDSLAKIIADEIKIENYEFIKSDSANDLLKESEQNPNEEIIILDVVKGLQEVKILSINDLKTNNVVSLHDFDLSFFLQLLEKTGMIKNLKIIGIPMKGDKQLIIEEIKKII